MTILIGKPIICYDVETDSLDVNIAKIKWFGAYSYLDDKYYIIPFQGNEKDIKELIHRHKIIVGFNQKDFDNPILKNNLNDEEIFDYKVQIDLLEISAPKSGKNFGQFRKNRLAQMGIKLKSFTLKNIIEKLKLDEDGTKGDIDYKIFQKDTWTSEEVAEIKKYLKQDVELTKMLFLWYDEQFSPLKKFLPEKDQNNFLYLKTSLSVLAYNIICNKAGLLVEFGEKDPNRKSYSGGHHLEQRWDLVKGNIIEVDFACLLEGEYVFTTIGYKKVENLKIGDNSLSLDNKINKINKIQKEKSDEIIEFHLSNGDILKVTPNHKIPIFKEKKKNKPINIKEELIKAEKVVIGDNFISPVIKHKLLVGKQEDIFELLGIFLCEGTQDRNERFLVDKKHPNGRKSTTSRTMIGIKNYEIDFKKRITKLIKKHCPYNFKWITLKKKSKNKEYTNQSIKNTTKEFYFWFKNLVNKNFNLIEITKNEARIKSFISGVFKSDATFNILRKEIVLQNHNKKLMMIVRRCLDILGIYYNTYQSKNPESNSVKLTNSISITYGSELNKLFSWFKFNSYRDERVKFKDSVYNQNKKIVKVINIIKRKGDFDVYNISMDRQDSPYYIHNGYYTKNSAYPHAIMMANLHSNVKDDEEGWKGDGYYHIEGKYDNKKQGKIELALKDIFLERLKAKNGVKEARKSGDKNKEIKDDAKNKSFKIVINCFSEDTNIMTIDGIKKLKECKVGDLVYSINPKTEEVEIKPIEKIYEQEYCGDMIHFNDRNKDLLVTPEHQMLFKSRRKNKTWIPIKKIEARDVIGRSGKYPNIIPINGLKNECVDIGRMISIKDLFYFIGIVLSEGTIRYKKTKYLRIGQYKNINKEIYSKIKKCLNNLNIKYTYDGRVFNIHERFWIDFIRKYHLNSFECFIPDWCWKYDSSLLKYLHEGLYDGDGTKRRYIYSTVSRRLKEDVIRLNFHLGYRTTVSYEKYTTKVNGLQRLIYRITRTGNGDYRKKDSIGYIQNPTNKIICCSVKDNHTVYVGRNDKLIWTGQSEYGLTGNPIFKSIYNRKTASDCTSIVRTWMKKLAKKLETTGFINLYGFTDSIYVLIPPPLQKKDLMLIIKNFIDEAKSHVPFPMDTFNMEVEEEIKMIWFVAKNCYLFVTQDNKVKYKSTLLNTNTPKAVMKLFKEYIEPIIIETLDIPFTKQELEIKLKEMLEKEPELALQEYKVTELGDYKVNTSLQYQISEKYGSGRHFLIPNKKGIGIGRSKNNKRKRGLRHCTIEEFKKNNLTINDIDLKHLLSHLKSFYEKNEKHYEDKFKQRELFSRR